MKISIQKRQKTIIRIVLILEILLVVILGAINSNIKKEKYSKLTQEERQAVDYDQVTNDDANIDGTDYVKFSAFFLRDLDKDGYAEKYNGTCKELGNQDTLYMELNVLTKGYLKDAKIQIDGKNFYLQTAIPKDEQIKKNVIGNDIKEIELNDLNNGTQKLMSGFVRSGDYSHFNSYYNAIGKNTKNYSRSDNKIILTGIYVDDNGNETEIRKESPLTMDWYGTAATSIYNTSQTFYNIGERVNGEEGKLTLNFSVYTEETKEILNIYSNYVEGIIPQLNGYDPIEVTTTSSYTDFTYDETTRKFTITRVAETNPDGTYAKSVSRRNSYGMKVVYPIQAYEANGEEFVRISIPVSTYYECYNNPNPEFQNPYKTNIAQTTISILYRTPLPVLPPEPDKPVIYTSSSNIKVGRYVSSPSGNSSYYMVPKTKPIRLYNGASSEETDDTYIVYWYAFTGTNKEYSNVIMKETKDGQNQKVDQFVKSNGELISMEDFTSNVGIYFSGASNFLKNDGFIKVYDDTTDELLVTFTKDNWNNYSSSKPYRYNLPVKHIRIETSNTNEVSSLYVYNVKELDDEAIVSRFSREEFDDLSYIKSNLSVTMGEAYSNVTDHQAKYEEPYSIANISISKDVISTQLTEEHMQIKIETETNTSRNQVKWKNGSFLVKMPEEILTVVINDVNINNNSVAITSYEVVEINGTKCIKINTSNTNPTDFEITIDADITPDPRIPTTTKNLELYAYNYEAADYYYKGADIYDVNDNSNIEENVNKRSTSINLVAPNSLLTNQIVSEFDDENSIVVSPEIADLKPIYDDTVQEKETVKINVQLRNNYNGIISDAIILGKIPFEGNTYVLSGKNLNSTFSTSMQSSGIQVPEQLRGKVDVYYSANPNPTKELSDSTNGWVLANDVTDWSQIKTFLIDFKDATIDNGIEYNFSYTVEIPFGVEFNEIAYSHHGIWFNLNTEAGKYRTKTEPNKVGIRIADKYNLELYKYQTGKTKLVQGATYKVSKLTDDGNIEESQTSVTNAQGKLMMANLYAERIYEIQEIKTPTDYELNTDIIRFVGHIDRSNGTLTIEKLQGTTKEDIQVIKNEEEDYRANVKVEDEAKASIKITKLEQGTETPIRGIRYKITGAGLPENGRTITTNATGEVTLKGLKIGEIYTLQETKAEGYYLASEPVVFKIINNEGTYEVEVISGEFKETSITLNDEIPTVNVVLEDEKIPTYNLVLNKIEKGKNEVKLEGAKFKLYKETKEMGSFITDENGQVTIEGLYQYVEGKPENASYTLKEVLAPEGYAKVADINFKVSHDGEKLVFEGDRNFEYTSEGNTLHLIIPDSPSFKLIKKDGETTALLPNVKFAIYNVDDGEVPARNSKGEIVGTREIINGKEYYTVTTDENGEITADLPEGLYKAVEVEAPVQYDISKGTEYFGVGKSREGKKDARIDWKTSIGNIRDDSIQKVIREEDGDYIVAGYITNENENPSKDGIIAKYDNYGQEIWKRIISGEGDEELKYIADTFDGGCLACGTFSSEIINFGNNIIINNHGNVDGMIIKFNSDGDVEWAESIGGTLEDVIKSVNPTSDGGYIIGGYFKSRAIDFGNNFITSGLKSYESDGMIVKYDANRNAEWMKQMGGSEMDTIYWNTYGETRINDVKQTKDGGFIAIGEFSAPKITLEEGIRLKKTNTYELDYYTDGMIIKYDENGNYIWAKDIDGIGTVKIVSVAETDDLGYIIGGYFDCGNLRFGNEITVSNHDPRNIYSGWGYDGVIAKYDMNGNAEWANNVGASGKNRDDYIYDVSETKDNGYIAVGSSRKNNKI